MSASIAPTRTRTAGRGLAGGAPPVAASCGPERSASEIGANIRLDWLVCEDHQGAPP
jgi:hypothetical protein